MHKVYEKYGIEGTEDDAKQYDPDTTAKRIIKEFYPNTMNDNVSGTQ
jgi:hypothetical protein